MNELVDGFIKVLGGEPLSLALCAMNLLLLYFLFKQGAEFVKQRGDAMKMIVDWQTETQKLLANCVNKEIMSLIIDALERDRETYRAMLPDLRNNPPPQAEPRNVP